MNVDWRKSGPQKDAMLEWAESSDLKQNVLMQQGTTEAAVRDYKKKKHRTDLDKDCKTATPKMWSNYIITSTVIKIIRDGFLKYLKSKLETTFYTECRRPNQGKFYDSSRGKVVRHKLENRLDMIDNLDWMPATKSNNAIRLMLKKHFDFNFDSIYFEGAYFIFFKNDLDV